MSKENGEGKHFLARVDGTLDWMYHTFSAVNVKKLKLSFQFSIFS